jgi:hypothetical protein
MSEAQAVTFTFKGKNETAQQQARLHGAIRVREISEETEAAVRALVVSGIKDGIPPVRLARQIKETIGLTTRQARSVQRYQERLVRQGMKKDRIQKLTKRYRDKKLRERSRVIAQTEAMGALNKGKLVAAEQAVAEGLLDNPVKRWVTGADERVCPKCGPMSDESVPLDDAFSNGLMAPPAHPRCRCTISVVEGDPLVDYIPKEFQHAKGILKKPTLTKPAAPPAPAPAELKPKDPIWKIATYSEEAQKAINAMAHEMERDYGVTLRLSDRAQLAGHLERKRGVPAEHAPQFAEEMVLHSVRLNRDGLRQMRAAGVDLGHIQKSVIVYGWETGSALQGSYAWAGRGKPSKWAKSQGDYKDSMFEHQPQRYPGGKAETRQILLMNMEVTTSYWPASDRRKYGLTAFEWEASDQLGGFFPFWHPKVQAAHIQRELRTGSTSKTAPSNTARTPIHETGHLLHTHKWDHNRSYVEFPQASFTRQDYTRADAGGFAALWDDLLADIRAGHLGETWRTAPEDTLRSMFNRDMVDPEVVGGYGATKPTEWLPEVFTHMVHGEGKALTPMQKWVYKALKGPEVPGRSD